MFWYTYHSRSCHIEQELGSERKNEKHHIGYSCSSLTTGIRIYNVLLKCSKTFILAHSGDMLAINA